MEPFIGEIKICAFNFAPAGWALCDGSTLQVQQNQALFSLLYTQYGGNGTTTFALPDLRGRTAVHRSGATGFVQGNKGGVEDVQLTAATMPLHTHTLQVSTAPATAFNVGSTSSNLLAQSALHNASNPSITGPGNDLYVSATPATNLTPLEASACSSVGTGVAHDNMQPSLVLNYMICTSGIYPSRS